MQKSSHHCLASSPATITAYRKEHELVLRDCEVLRYRTGLRPDKELLSELYGLAPREADLCCSLASGLSLQQAGLTNGISYESGRQRLKTIFEKTATHNQTELRLIPSKLSTDTHICSRRSYRNNN